MFSPLNDIWKIAYVCNPLTDHWLISRTAFYLKSSVESCNVIISKTIKNIYG